MNERPHIDITLLPESLQRMVKGIGLSRAMRLVAEHGGMRPLHIPKSMSDDHPIAQLVGGDAARWLCTQYAGCDVPLPRASRALLALRDAEIAQRLLQGESPDALAREFGMTMRNVFIIKQKTRNTGIKKMCK